MFKKGTGFLEIILAVKMAPGTKAALFKTAQAGAEQRPEAGQLRRLAQSLKGRPKQPVFWKSIWLRTSLEIEVQSRPQGPADLLKGSRVIKQGSDSKTFFKR